MNKNILNSPLQQLRRMAMALASIVAVVAVALMTACGSNDDPPDPTDPDYVAPYTISMRVLSNDGTNLLDPKAMGNILKDSVTVSFGDMSYQLDTIPSAKELPTGVPHEATDNFYGLWLYKPVGTTNYLMQFGEFGGKTNLTNQQFIIHWNDGTKDDTVSFDHTYSKKTASDEGTYSTVVRLNKKPATLPITFKKER